MAERWTYMRERFYVSKSVGRVRKKKRQRSFRGLSSIPNTAAKQAHPLELVLVACLHANFRLYTAQSKPMTLSCHSAAFCELLVMNNLEHDFLR